VTQTLDYYPYGSQRIASGSSSEQRRFIGEEFDGGLSFLISMRGTIRVHEGSL
jgi:hypothetical protein